MSTDSYDECGRPRCPECKVCPICSGDGHAESCSREGDEYTPEQLAAIRAIYPHDESEADRA